MTWSEEYYRILGLDPSVPPDRRSVISMSIRTITRRRTGEG